MAANATLYVVDLPPKRKASVSSYPEVSRGRIPPSRVLTPVLGERPSWCCPYGGPYVLRYEIGVFGARLYLPFLRDRPTGGTVTDVYEFNVTQDGVSTPITSLLVGSSQPGDENPFVVAASVVGP